MCLKCPRAQTIPGEPIHLCEIVIETVLLGPGPVPPRMISRAQCDPAESKAIDYFPVKSFRAAIPLARIRLRIYTLVASSCGTRGEMGPSSFYDINSHYCTVDLPSPIVP